MSAKSVSVLSTEPPTPEPDAPSHATAEIDRLWNEFKRSGSRALRDKLILHYSPLAKYVGARVAAGLPQSVDQSDLVSYGIFGLIDAIEKFDLARGLQVRDVRDLADQGCDPRRAPLDRLGAPFGAGQVALAREGVHEARGDAAAQPDRRRARGRDETHARTATGAAHADLLARSRRSRRDALVGRAGRVLDARRHHPRPLRRTRHHV